MKITGYFLISLGTLLFLFFKFIVVKIAYFKYPQGTTFSGFWDILIAAYTQYDTTNGVFHELYGPISGIKNIVYILCALCILLGLTFLIYKETMTKAQNEKRVISNVGYFNLLI